MDEIKNKLDENKNSDSSLSINGTPTGTERQLSHSSGDTLRPFPLRHREHTGEESKAYSEFIESFFEKILINTVDTPPEIQRVINEHFWELI